MQLNERGLTAVAIGSRNIANLMNCFLPTNDTSGAYTLPCVAVSNNINITETTVALQTTLAGTQQDWWPPGDTDKYYSKPLSDIPPNSKAVSIAVCAVFTFNTSNQITQLVLYL